MSRQKPTCDFCHVQIDRTVYRAQKAKLHQVCRPLFLERPKREPHRFHRGPFRLMPPINRRLICSAIAA
jgi:hypothetical protein